MRLDKWLWAARFFKTRGLAAQAIAKGRVQLGGQLVKCARELRVGDELSLRQGELGEPARTIQVLGLSETRGPAPVARLLYEETPESVAARVATSRNRRYAADPALSIEKGRPTKRRRRDLAAWQRWSATADD